MGTAEQIEDSYNRRRVRNCLNCGRLASYLRLMQREKTVTCMKDGKNLSEDHPRLEGSKVELCWVPRGTPRLTLPGQRGVCEP